MVDDFAERPRNQAIFFFLDRYKVFFGLILSLTLIGSVLESLSVAAFFPLFSSMLSDSQGETGGILGVMDRMVDLIPVSSPILAASLILIALFFTKTILLLLRDFTIAYGSAKVLYAVKNEVMERYANADYQHILNNRQGTIIYNNLTATNAVSDLLLSSSRLATNLFKILAITVVLALVFPLAALSLVVLGLGYYGIIHYLSNRVSFSLGEKRARAGTEQTVITNEFFNGFRHIVAFRAVGWWLNRFNQENRTFSEMYAKQLAWLAVPRPLMEFFILGLMLGFILILRATSSNNFSEVLPSLGVFAVGLAQVLPSLTNFGHTRMQMMGALPNVERAYQIITGHIQKRDDGSTNIDSFEKAILFENISFAHQEREPLFQNLDFTIEKGKVTAIVGPSGAGKTTIVNLLLRIFNPTGGRITVDGVPLTDIRQDSWLGKVGFVSQDLFAYNSSIADNIVFGRIGYSAESLINASRIANAHDFISEFPDGYDTVIGDRGMKLSGGQQQRLAIARAMLDSPEILIFDEATSSLDSISEKQVQQAIDKVSSDRTVIVIAHRLSTIRNADKIIVLDNGRVVEQGTHQELLERQGDYARLVTSSR